MYMIFHWIVKRNCRVSSLQYAWLKQSKCCNSRIFSCIHTSIWFKSIMNWIKFLWYTLLMNNYFVKMLFHFSHWFKCPFIKPSVRLTFDLHFKIDETRRRHSRKLSMFSLCDFNATLAFNKKLEKVCGNYEQQLPDWIFNLYLKVLCLFLKLKC